MPTETKGEQLDQANTPDGRSEAETAMGAAYRCSDDTGPSLALHSELVQSLRNRVVSGSY